MRSKFRLLILALLAINLVHAFDVEVEEEQDEDDEKEMPSSARTA